MNSAATTVDAKEVCRAIIAEHSKSFALASRLLPAGVQDDAVVLYAWCRRADDAVDRSESPRASLDRLSVELDQILEGTIPEDPVLSSFADVVFRRRIPTEYPRELLAGMEMDVEIRRYRSIDDLLIYCHRAAGVVGLMMCHVLGVSNDCALPHAAHLGIAMQLTNICRDVQEDWRRGRLYVPENLLDHPTLAMLRKSEGDDLPAGARRGLAEAIHELLNLAQCYYRSADAGLAYLDWRCATAIRAARNVYSAIGDRIVKSGCDALAGRATTSKPEKLALVGRAAACGFIEFPRKLLQRRESRPPSRVLRAADAVRLA